MFLLAMIAHLHTYDTRACLNVDRVVALQRGRQRRQRRARRVCVRGGAESVQRVERDRAARDGRVGLVNLGHLNHRLERGQTRALQLARRRRAGGELGRQRLRIVAQCQYEGPLGENTVGNCESVFVFL